MAESTDPPVEKKARTFSEKEWAAVAEHILAVFKRRKADRADVEGKWAEADRQLAMLPEKPGPNDPAWMPQTELPWQSQAHETLVADCRRLIFPSDRQFFSAKAALTSADDMKRLNFAGFTANEDFIPTAKAIKAGGEQAFADRLPVAMLQKYHQHYDFRAAVDGLNAEAIAHGNFVGHIKWVTDDATNEDFSGPRPKKYPALIPCSMWNTYLDDSPAKMFAEGIHVGPGIIRVYQMRLADLKLAVKRGTQDVTDMLGGWRRKSLAKVEESIGDANKEHVRITRFDGDLVVPMASGKEIFLPNVIVDVCDQGPVVVRYRERDLPFSPYIVGHYHRDDVRSPYSSSPMIKGVPIQKAAVHAMKFWMVCAALHAAPPVRYNPYDPHYSANGGPDLTPFAKWAANTNPDPVEMGDPTTIMAGYTEFRRQYEEETGVTGARLGQQTKSHQTAFAIDQEVTRGMTRTVDYVSASLHGALRTFLYMEYEMAKEGGEETVYLPEYGGFVTASGKNLPSVVEFDIAGSGTPIDERERRNNQLAALQALIATAPAAQQSGVQVNVPAAVEDILRLGGIFDTKRYFPGPGTEGAAGAPPPLPIGPQIPGIAAQLPGSPI